MKFVEIVPGYPLTIKARPIEDYFYWPAQMMLDKGYEVEFLTNQLEGPGQYQDVKIKRFKSWGQIHKYVNRDKDIRLVHAHLRPYPATFFGLLMRKPKIMSAHTYILGSNPLIAKASVFMMNKYDKIVCFTPHEMQIYEKAGIRKEKLVLIPHPVDHKFFSQPIKGKEAIKKQYGIRDEFVVITFATIRKVKRIETLLKAFRIFSRKVKSKLIIVGTDLLPEEGLQSVEEMARELGVDVIRAKQLEPEELRRVLSIANVFVNSSEIEAQGLAVYEAAAAGLPLCLSSIGSLTSVFGNLPLYHDYWDYEKLAENLHYYYHNPQAADKSVKKLKELVRAFDISSISRKMEALYEEVMAR